MPGLAGVSTSKRTRLFSARSDLPPPADYHGVGCHSWSSSFVTHFTSPPSSSLISTTTTIIKRHCDHSRLVACSAVLQLLEHTRRRQVASANQQPSDRVGLALQAKPLCRPPISSVHLRKSPFISAWPHRQETYNIRDASPTWPQTILLVFKLSTNSALILPLQRPAPHVQT